MLFVDDEFSGNVRLYTCAFTLLFNNGKGVALTREECDRLLQNYILVTHSAILMKWVIHLALAGTNEMNNGIVVIITNCSLHTNSPTLCNNFRGRQVTNGTARDDATMRHQCVKWKHWQIVSNETYNFCQQLLKTEKQNRARRREKVYAIIKYCRSSQISNYNERRLNDKGDTSFRATNHIIQVFWRPFGFFWVDQMTIRNVIVEKYQKIPRKPV